MIRTPSMLDVLHDAGAAAAAVISTVAAVVAAVTLPVAVDMRNPVPLGIFAAVCLVVGYLNGWKGRGVYNDLSAEADARIEQMKLDREAERDRLKAESDAEQARLDALNKANIEIALKEHDRKMRRQDESDEAMARRVSSYVALTPREADFMRELADSETGTTYSDDSELLTPLAVKGAVFVDSGTYPYARVTISPEWQAWLTVFRDEFETVRANASKGGRGADARVAGEPMRAGGADA